uniref:Uncharacterized protein n=1 Tax=Magallana gigas TaxID=29159 RepID=A0A8W8KNU2_MAGGI
MVLICLVLLLIADIFTNICSSAEDLEDGICNRSTIIPRCCTGFVYNDTLKQCIACVGRFGTNCSQSCPQGYYGRRCSQTCTCNITLCDNVLGCSEATSDEGMMTSSLVRYSDVGHPMKPPELVVEQKDVIYVNTMMLQKLNNKRFLTTCCRDDENANIHNNDTLKKICEVCIGHPCRKCPWGYYGEQCNEKCTCSTELCHDVLGCVTAEYITRDSPVIYAAVVRPNRKPVRRVEQSDLMYGKMPTPQTSDQKRDTKAKCLDINISNNQEGEMKTIGLYMVVRFSGIIFVIADEQGDVGSCLGLRCRPKCPEGHYGKQCDKTCTCDADVCDDVSGCVTAEMKTIVLYMVVGFSGIIFVAADGQGDAGCDHRTFQSLCCSNDRIHYNDTINEICRACIGRLCTPTCPRGYHRHQCIEICTCDADECGNKSGCVTTVSSDNITRDSPVIYAAVVRPNKKLVRGVEQSDQMYGNTLKLQKPNRERKAIFSDMLQNQS